MLDQRHSWLRQTQLDADEPSQQEENVLNQVLGPLVFQETPGEEQQNKRVGSDPRRVQSEQDKEVILFHFLKNLFRRQQLTHFLVHFSRSGFFPQLEICIVLPSIEVRDVEQLQFGFRELLLHHQVQRTVEQRPEAEGEEENDASTH